MEAVVIFPHQLFENHPALKKERLIVLVEDRRFFSEFAFHKQKLVLHRASMKSFEEHLINKGFKTLYLEGDFEEILEKKRIASLHFVELDDVELFRRFQEVARKTKVEMQEYQSPGFLTTPGEFIELFRGKKQLSCQTFYIYQRKKLGVLLDDKGKPVGGKWSFDSENRKRCPKNLKLPDLPKFTQTEAVKEAISYVERKYSKNPGLLDHFNYPTTHQLAKKALKDFLQKRFYHFGDYEDAILQDEEVLFHSCLSPLINIGLLTPDQVLEETLNFAEEHDTPLNSLEGFVRQLIGWREFVRGVYHTIGEKQRSGNFFKHKRKLSGAFYEGTSGILPVDAVIKKLQKSAYLHHIERLMVLGNFFFVCEVSPDEIYRWFMELFIDSYDWVMIPNVYGMSQYADGGMMTTKPYFSGSNYLLKMSDFEKGPWCGIWDALFWRFMIKHEKFFAEQPRLQILHQMAMKKKEDPKIDAVSKSFLSSVFS